MENGISQLTVAGSIITLLLFVIGYLFKNLLDKLESGNIQIADIHKDVAVILEKMNNFHDRIKSLEDSHHRMKNAMMSMNGQLEVLRAKGYFDKDCNESRSQ